MSASKPINVDIHYNKDDLTFMFSGREFRRMMALNKREYTKILEQVADNVKRKRGRFIVIEQKNWNAMMEDACGAMHSLINDALMEYRQDHDTADYVYGFGYCEIPDLVYITYCNAKQELLS